MKKPKMPVQRGPRVITEEHKFHWRAAQVLFAELLDDLDEEFSRAGIEYMPIKGAYLIKSGMAEEFEFREMDDIDILVQEKDFTRAVEHFRKSGKATMLNDNWFFEQPFIYRARGITGHVELNFLLNRKERFLLETEQMFERSENAGEFCRLPSPEDAALITICHSLVHIAWTLRESAFREVEIISSRETFSWDEFWSRAEKTGVEKYIRRFIGKFWPASWKCSPPTSVHSGTANLEEYYKTPVPLRRLLWELPYVRRPFNLTWKRLRRILPIF